VLEAMLAKYAPADQAERERALREVMQEVALAGLYRRGFFEKAAFYGGTALRIFYGLDRFSEDLDFSLLRSDPGFLLEPYFEAIIREFEAVGLSVEIATKPKSVQSAIESAFLKSQNPIYHLAIGGEPLRLERPVKIKFEIDTDPPLGFQTEEKLLLMPFSFYVKCFALSDLFAGKLHALLFRQWKNRVKGRDWFDYEWYVRHGHAVSLAHFKARAVQSGHLGSDMPLDGSALKAMIKERIASVDLEAAKADVRRFLQDDHALAIWGADYFSQLTDRLLVINPQEKDSNKC
jgi:hypothetical protein